jgi:MOSC domain-containing protein YiiM
MTLGTSGARIDSASGGDPDRHLELATLETRLRAMPEAPRDAGRLRLLVRKTEGGVREMPPQARLTRAAGLEGDSWGRAAKRRPDAQLTVMEHGVAELIANGQPLALFGDQLFIELDLSRENLPPGTRVRVGAATLEVTAKPHNGCRKFKARFGADALQFVSRADLRHRNFRGIYVRVVEDGDVRVGDDVEVVRPGVAP